MIGDAIVAASRSLVRDRLTTGTSGNISVRDGQLFWITPSGVAPDEMTAEQIVAVDADGEAADAPSRPSSEWQFHLAVYEARPDIGAIVHTHSPWATAVSCTRRDLPPFHYMMVGTGDGTLRCAPYDPQQYCLAQLIGGPELLDRHEVAELAEIFKTYGQQPRESIE